MQTLQRTRHLPGPPLLLALGWLVLFNTAVRAHDPGLSSLYLNVKDNEISASLTIAASDVEALAPTGEPRQQLSRFVQGAIRLSIDDEVIPSAIHEVSFAGTEARVKLSFATQHSGGARRLSITSDVPKWIGRGHRQLVVVSVDARVMSETLVDSNSRPVTVGLAPGSFTVARLLGVVMMAMTGSVFLIQLWRRAPAPADPL